MVMGMSAEIETGKVEGAEAAEERVEYVVKYEAEGAVVFTEIVNAKAVNEKEFLRRLQSESVPHWLEPELEDLLERVQQQIERARYALKHSRGLKDALADLIGDGYLEKLQRVTLAALCGCTAKVWKVKRKGDAEKRKLVLVVKYMPLWATWWQL